MNEIIRVKIYGLNLSRMINRLVLEGVLLNNIVIKNKFIIFSLKERDKNLLDKICKIEKKNYVITNRFGILNFFKKIPYLFGGLFAIVIIACYMYSIGVFVHSINIVNDSNIDFNTNKVELFLKKEGITAGCDKRNYSEEYIQNVILDNFEDVSGCVVKYSGVFLNIKLYPTVNEFVLDKKDIYSKYDGIVTSLDVYAGKTNLKVGDIVKSGDLLIKNSDGVSGKVEGKVFFSSTKLYNKVREEIVYSGNFESYKTLSIYNKIIYKEENNCSFSRYLTKKCDFYLTDKYVLPVLCEEIFCFEYELKQEIVEFEEVEENIKTELLEEVKEKIPIDAEILNTTYSIVEEGNYTRIDCFVESIVSLV